jgi:hypothetical protein
MKEQIYFPWGNNKDQIQILMVNKILNTTYECDYSPGDSSVVILDPKREGKGPKTPPTYSSSFERPISRKNLDPEPVAVVLDPEKLPRKPKVISR